MAAIASIQKLKDEMTSWRRDLHRKPELAFEEIWTSDYVAKCLDGWGATYDRGLAKTAIVVTIEGSQGTSGKKIGLRADMDALEIQECTGLDYCSTHVGKMHGCGHDGHTTMLLGAVKHLLENRDFNGTVYAIFQPAEEGAGGARVMLEEGFLEKYPCDMIFGMHNWPGIPEGVMAIRSGAMTAASDRFTMTVTGKGGHAAMPHLNVDVVTLASTIVMSLQTLVSRKVDPAQSAVLSVCKLHAGTDSLNVMPDQVELGGTIRTFDADTRNMMETKIKEIAEGLARAHGAKIEYQYSRGYPSVVNSEVETELAKQAAISVVGQDNFEKFTPTMGAEDFAYFLEKIPGAYIILGQESKEKSAALHSPNYDFNDDVLPIGASYWVKLVETILA